MTGHSPSGKRQRTKPAAIPFAEAQKLVHNTAHAFVAGKPSAEDILKSVQEELAGAQLYDTQTALLVRISRAKQILREHLE